MMDTLQTNFDIYKICMNTIYKSTNKTDCYLCIKILMIYIM